MKGTLTMKAPKRKVTTHTSRSRAIARRSVARLQEPSTYASLAAITAIAGLQVDQSVWRDLAMVGAALAGVAGVVLPEGNSK